MASDMRQTTEQSPVPPAEIAAENPVTDADRVIREHTVITDGQATTTAVEDTTVVVPSAATLQRRRLARTRRVIYFIVNVIAIFVLIRFFLAMLGANPENAFARLIYGITAPFLLPFKGLFGPESEPTYGVPFIEAADLVAIGIYYLFAWIASKIAGIVYSRSRVDPASADVPV